MWGAIKKAINSNLNKSLDVLIQEKTTETNNKVDTKASQESIVSLDTKVQEGKDLIGATNNTGGTASVGSVFAKLNKLLTDWTTIRAGYLDTSLSSRQASWGATIVHRDRIDTTISSRASQASVDTLLNGRVVKSVQRGTVSIPKIPGSINIPINNVDVSKAIILLNGAGYYENTTSSTASRGFAIIPYINSFTNNSIGISSNGTSDSSYTISWQVIEFY